MFDNLSTQKRLLIATAIAILFFVIYDSFMVPKRNDLNATNAANSAVTNNTAAPQIQGENGSGAAENAPGSASAAAGNGAAGSGANAAPGAKNSNLNISNKIITEIKSEIYTAKIDDLGRIASFVLNEEKFKDENGKQISLINPANSPLPLEIRFSNASLNEKAFKTPYQANLSEIKIDTENGENQAKALILKQDLGELVVTKTIIFKPLGDYDLKVELSKNEDYFLSPGMRPDVIADGYTVHGTMVRKNDGSLEIYEDGDIKGDERASGDMVASSDRYYTTLFYEPNLDIYLQNDKNENSIAFVRGNSNFKALGYIGPKDYRVLESINPSLSDVVEYGWFTFIAKPAFLLLDWLYKYIGNWGWAIVVMTLIIRIVLFPLTYKGMVSMNKLKDLAPKMKEIQTKFKGDPAKINAHVMELYRKNGANPMGGCLPILIQIPIFFAIYRVLLNAIELKGAAWLGWVEDLAVMDPYFVLPILMGATMYLQQRITPTNFTDPMQEKIMRFLPLIFTFFFMTFPAGLTLYWFINNLCSIIQQYFVNKIFARHKAEIIAEKHHDKP